VIFIVAAAGAAGGVVETGGGAAWLTGFGAETAATGLAAAVV